MDITIGATGKQQTYYAGFNPSDYDATDKSISFYIDVPKNEIRDLDTSNISYKVHSHNGFVLEKSIYDSDDYDAMSITPHFKDSNIEFSIDRNQLVESKTAITGTVENAQSGNMVEIKVGTVILGTTKVKADNNFELTVENNALINKGEQSITATLATNGQKVSDVATMISQKTVSDNFVESTDDVEYAKLPKFMQYVQRDDNYGIPRGTKNIKYYFATEHESEQEYLDEGNSGTSNAHDFTAEHKAVIKGVLTTINFL
ncbi:MAG: hypothetical protein KGV46_03030 [Pasteurella sp.]|nr:hypothetical protein [Pasteurella sp.]